MYSCSKCHKAITERTVSMCDNRFWHSACLTCQMCGHTPAVVGESLYAYRGSLICKNDYMKMKCVCKTCQRPITQSDLVIRAKNYGYMHDKCVYCNRCRHHLETGDRYMLTTENTIICQKCIIVAQQNPQNAQQQQPTGQLHSHNPNQSPHNSGPMGQIPGHNNSTGPQQGPPPNAYMGGPGGMMSSNGYNGGLNNGMNHHHPHHVMNSVQGGPTPPPPVPTSTTATTGRRGRKRANML